MVRQSQVSAAAWRRSPGELLVLSRTPGLAGGKGRETGSGVPRRGEWQDTECLGLVKMAISLQFQMEIGAEKSIHIDRARIAGSWWGL